MFYKRGSSTEMQTSAVETLYGLSRISLTVLLGDKYLLHVSYTFWIIVNAIWWSDFFLDEYKFIAQHK